MEKTSRNGNPDPPNQSGVSNDEITENEEALVSAPSSETSTLSRSNWNDGNETVKWIGVGATILVFVVVAAVVLLEQFRIRSTRDKIETLAVKYEAKTADRQTPDPPSGALPELDGWGRPIDLKVTWDLLGAAITVRSSGPDRELRTMDDLFTTRIVLDRGKAIAKNVGKAAVDAAKKKSADKIRQASHALKDKWDEIREASKTEATPNSEKDEVEE